MKKAFIVTSAIEIPSEPALSYSGKRNVFTTEERINQTIDTIASIDFHSKDDTVIYLLDLSTDSNYMRETFSYQKNLKYISIKDEFPEIFETVRTHYSKGYCETSMVKSFFKKYYEELTQFDFFIKMSGRYLFEDNTFNTNFCNEANLNKLIFMRHILYAWDDYLNYTIFDAGPILGRVNSCIYPTVCFAWGSGYLDKMIDIFTTANHLSRFHDNALLSLEHFFHYLSRPYELDIIEEPWVVYGLCGWNGELHRYD